MTRLTRLALARYAVFGACMAVAYGMGLQDVARPSGIDAPELSERPVVPFVNGRPVAKPIAPDWSAVLPFGAWGGCWDCPTHPGVVDDEAQTVPIPGAVWAAATAIAALAFMAERQRRKGARE